MLAFVLTLLQAAPSHAALHPASAEVFLESPDVPALLAAYPTAPMARLAADADALAAARKVLGRPDLDARGLLASGLGLAGLDGDAALAELSALRAVSLSLSATGDGGAALAIVDAVDAAAAERLERLLADVAHPFEWTEREGARLALGAGATTPEAWRALRDGAAPALGSDAAFPAGFAADDAQPGAVVLRAFQRRNALAVLETALQRPLVPGPALWESAFGDRPMHLSMRLAGGRFVTESHAPGATAPLAAAPWIGVRPFDPALLAEVHPGALLVAAASFDREGLRDALERALAADLSGAAFFDRLGDDAVLFAQPFRSPAVGVPPSFAVVELERPEGAFADLAALGDLLAAAHPGVTSKTRTYKDVEHLYVSLPDDFGALGELRPTLAVLDGRLVIANGALLLKGEIRRRLGDPDEALGPAQYPWTGGALAADGAGALIYVDWAAQVDAAFALVRAFGGLIRQMAPDAGLDLAALPASAVFTRHLVPTTHLVRVDAAGVHHRHEAGFAFETWIGLAGLGAEIARALAGEAVEVEAAAPADPIARTRAALTDLRAALAVYRIETGAHPAALDALVVPTETYPRGFLDGLAAVPLDGWGRAFRFARDGDAYRLWSTGPDGVDQDGAGDDVR